jgi:hypothetical protein
VLILAFGQIDLNLTCRLLMIKEEDLKLKLRRMHSLLHYSDSGIKPYHISLLFFLQDRKRAGKYYLHPFLVALVQVPATVNTVPPATIALMIMIMILTITALTIVKGYGKLFSIIFGIGLLLLGMFILGIAKAFHHSHKATVIRQLLAEPTE